ncbi:P-loop containing nucleoside triphosphate hydrolase [Phytophthora cactorum]|nr:P-loop containing nucleoside triphosphate hydrolase [Phytophthora cactorum]
MRRRLRGTSAAHAARSGFILSLQHPKALIIPDARFFQSLGLSGALSDRLTQFGLTTPTSVQYKAIPRILSGEDVVVAAETGGGKTLAFLLPIVEQLRRNPLPPSEMRLPTALVLTTSQELVRQLAAVLHQVDPELARLAVSLSSSRQTLGHGSRACPLVLATPSALLRATKPRDFAFTQTVVVDEADMLLSGGFEKETKQILATIRNQPLLLPGLNSDEHKDSDFGDKDFSRDQTQTIFSAATIPDYGKRSGFHRTLPKLTLLAHNLQEFIASDDFMDEQHARCELLYQILTSGSGKKTLVFTNSIASADALFDFLEKEKSMANCALFHKEVARPERQKLLKRLDSDDDADKDLVVICTDIAARGLDTTKVGHVVQFEFASDVVSYLHRIGRTGRAGTAGTVSSIESSENSLVLDKIREAGASTLQTPSVVSAVSERSSGRRLLDRLPLNRAIVSAYCVPSLRNSCSLIASSPPQHSTLPQGHVAFLADGRHQGTQTTQSDRVQCPQAWTANASSDGSKTKPIATACMEKLMGGITALSEGKHGDFYAGTNHSNMYQVQLEEVSSSGSGSHSNNAANRPVSAGVNSIKLRVALRSTCHYSCINDVVFPSSSTRSPADNSHLFLTCAKTDIRIWNARRCQEILRVQVPNLVCNCVELTRDGGLVVSGWDDGKVRAFYPESGKLKFVIQDAHNESVTAIAMCTPSSFSSSASSSSSSAAEWRLLTGGKDGRVRVWRITPSRQTMEASLKEHRGPVNAIQVTQDCTACVSASSDGSCIVWNLETFVRTQAMFASTVFRRVLYHPDESQLLTCGSDRRITYYDAYDGEAIRFLEEAADHEMLAMDIEHSGTLFATGGRDGMLRLWHYDNGETVAIGRGHSEAINAVKISPDRKEIVTVGSEGAIMIWEMGDLLSKRRLELGSLLCAVLFFRIFWHR